MHHTRADWLAALRDNPKDNTLRLVYADWLDEQSKPEVECPHCVGGRTEFFPRLLPPVVEICRNCNGSAVVADDSDAIRAALLRAGVRLDGPQMPTHVWDYAALVHEVQTLLGRLGDWPGGLRRARIRGDYDQSPLPAALYRRGEIAELRSSYGWWGGAADALLEKENVPQVRLTAGPTPTSERDPAEKRTFFRLPGRRVRFYVSDLEVESWGSAYLSERIAIRLLREEWPHTEFKLA